MFRLNLIIITLINLLLAQLSLAACAHDINNSSNPTPIHEALNGFNVHSFNPNNELNNILNSVISPQIDLNSAIHNISVGNLSHEIGINVNGHILEINSNQSVTPAEALALLQILSTHQQNLYLNDLGQGVAGSVNSALLGNNISNLVIPSKITLVDNSQPLVINGNLINYGDIQFVGNGNLTVNNLFNASTGEIQSTGSLTINANQSLINEGTIAASNGLTLNTSNIYNVGAIETMQGNLNINGSNGLYLTGNNNGNFEAINGSINLNDINGSNGINLISGNYLSKELNINAQGTNLQGITGDVTGIINIEANSAHLISEAKDMLLGYDKVKGDPTYVNPSGDITLNGSISSAGANIAIIASGNINVASGASVIINTTGGSSPGGNLVMIAGVGSNISYSGVNTTSGIPLPGTSIATGETVVVNLGASSGNTGGNIDLSTNNTLASGANVIATFGTPFTGTNNGGNVNLVAVSNGSVGGNINLGGYGINSSSGLYGGTAGNISLIDTTTSGLGILVGAMTGNNIFLGSVGVSQSSVTFDSSGSILSGSISGNPATLSSGNITINGNTSSSTLTLNTNGSINLNIANTYYAPNAVVLYAGTGSVGGFFSAPSISTSNLTVNAPNGSAYILDSFSSGVSLNQSSIQASGTFSLTNSGNITINGAVTAGTANGTGLIYLNTTSNGNILQTSPGNLLTASAVNLTTSGGNVGTSFLTPVHIDTGSFSVYTRIGSPTTGNAYIYDTYSGPLVVTTSTVGLSGALFITASGNLNVNDILSAGPANGTGIINLTAGNNNSLTINQSMTTGTVDLTSGSQGVITNAAINSNNISVGTNNNGAITIDSTIGLPGSSVIFNANGSGYITTGTNGVIVGNGLSLVTSNGEIGFGVGGLKPLITQANSIVFSAGLSVGISNTSNNLNLGNSGTNGNFYIYQTGNITASGLITAPVFGLYSFNGSAGIGLASSIIQINAHNVGLESLATGSSVYINNTYTGNNIMQASQASDIFKYTTAGSLSVYAQTNSGPGQISGQIIAIQTLGGYGIYNDALIQSNDFIFLTASSGGYIAQSATNANMIAPNISLVTGGGAIGAGTILSLNSANVAASTLSNNGFVNINDVASTSGIVGGQSGTNFTFNATGNLNVYGNIATGASASGGSITLTNNGTMNIGTSSAVNLTTNNGSVFITNNNTVSGSINISNGSYILGSSNVVNVGNVAITIGSFNAVNNPNPNPSSITVQSSGGAKVYFGNNGITAISPTNTLFANGRNIYFNTGSLAASAINLGGNVKITADPPTIPGITSVVLNLLTQNANLVTGDNVNLNQVNILNQTVNVLDNNQATGYTLNNNNANLNNELMQNKYSSNENNELNNTSYTSNESNELIKNTQIFMPISYSSKNNSFVLNTNLTSNYKTIKLTKGSLLIKTSQNTTFSADADKTITIQVAKGTLLLVINNGKVLSLYNLDDIKANSIKVTIAHKTIILNPGQHVSILPTQNSPNFAYINQVKTIGYKNLKYNTLSGMDIYQSDFSILSAINAIIPLENMFKSNDYQIIKLTRHLLKTAGIVMQTSSGNYHQILTQELTALESSNF